MAGNDSKSAAGRTMHTFTFKKIKDGGELKADIHGASDDESRPAVLFFHGGALIVGDRKLSNTPGSFLDVLLRAGYVVISVDYRLAPNVRIAQILEDVQDACKWTVEQGPNLFNMQPGHWCTMGQSAGGYLTLATGYRVEPRPKALVSFWGYGDIAGAWYSRPDPFYCKQPAVPKDDAFKEGGGKLYLYLRQQGLWPDVVAGHNPDKEPRAFDPICPIRNVTKKYPPTMLIHGDKDTDVPYEQSVLMDRELSVKSVPHEFITIPDGPHGFGGVDPVLVSRTYERMTEFLKKWVS